MITDALLGQLTEGKFLAVVLGRWQEKYPHVLAKEDIALRIGVSKKTLEKAMSDHTHLGVRAWLIIQKALDEGPIFERYVKIQKGSLQ